MLDEFIDSDSVKPDVDQYCEVSNSKDSANPYIIEKDLLMVHFLSKTKEVTLTD